MTYRKYHNLEPIHLYIIGKTLSSIFGTKKTFNFYWIKICEETLKYLKEYITEPSILSKPTDRETLYFLEVIDFDISAFLVREKDGQQHPIYCNSQSLLDIEIRYLLKEKLVLALVTTIRKLHPYFQSRAMIVVTSFPIRMIVYKLELTD